MDVDAYRAEAEEFLSALDLEYVLHFSGRKSTFDLDPIYERHAGLFDREAVERLRESAPRELVRFGVEGHIGRATSGLDAELARREAALTVELEGSKLPYRQVGIEQANEADPERRAAIEDARLRVMDAELNPLYAEAHEQAAGLARELGWTSTLALCEELSALDLRELGRQCAAFLQATEPLFEDFVGPELVRELGFGFPQMRRSDIGTFMRAPSLDAAFPRDRLLPAYESTLDGLGLDHRRILLDVEDRPNKTPRAFCAPVRIPDEVHVVMPLIGGRDDYEALMHETGHAQHYSYTARELPVEARYLGDNSVTEGFATLFQHLVSTPEWLTSTLGVADPQTVLAHSDAVRMVMLRRYCAKLLYELELHGGGLDEPGAERYAARLSAALHVDWPGTTWLSDLDPFFYAARYLRAWALETHLRRLLVERFGSAWFAEIEAGALLRSLFRDGQARGADELLAELSGERLDLAAVQAELSPAV